MPVVLMALNTILMIGAIALVVGDLKLDLANREYR